MLPMLASAGMAIFLLFCFVVKTRLRLKSTAAKTALMSGEIKRGGELYRAVVDNAADAIVLADQRGIVLTFNRAAERIFGYSEVGSRWPERQIAHPARSMGNPSEESGAIVSTSDIPHIPGIGRVVDGRRKDGTLCPLHLSMAEWSNGPDEVGVTAILRDITKPLQVQQALVESERRIRQIVDCATDYAIYQLDLDDRMVKWNTGTERILGYSAEELDGMDFRRFFPDEFTGELEAEQTAIAPLDLEGHETDGWMLRRDGNRFLGQRRGAANYRQFGKGYRQGRRLARRHVATGRRANAGIGQR